VRLVILIPLNVFTYNYIHSFIYVHSSKIIVKNNMYTQDNKAAYATLTVALYNWVIKHYYILRTHMYFYQ